MKYLIRCFTVAESKRLIAKAVAKLLQPEINKRIIAVARGTTCSYICEEALGSIIDKTSYVTGYIAPEGVDISKFLNKNIIKDVVLEHGNWMEVSVIESVKYMSAGDIFIKGANCLNYNKKIVGVLVGSLQGGTIGAVLSTIKNKKIRLIIPVGLEKNCTEPVRKISYKLNNAIYKNKPLRMIIIKGEIITEIEALKILTGVKVTQIAAGGIGGAEGEVMLYIEGNNYQIKKTFRLINKIKMEKPFLGPYK